MEPCPLKLIIYSTVHPDPVRIDNMTAVIYQSPQRYYIKVGYYRWTVKMAQDHNGFELEIPETTLRFLYGVLKQRGYIKQ